MRISLSQSLLLTSVGLAATSYNSHAFTATTLKSPVPFTRTSSALFMSTTSPKKTEAETNKWTSSKVDPTVAAVPKLAQRWRKKTKQLATLGPASSSKEMIEKLFLAGADVFRLNFSHGRQEQKKELLDIIREVEDKYSHPIAVLGDLQGPKLRVGEFSNPDGEMLEQVCVALTWNVRLAA